MGDSALVESDGDELVSQLGKRRWRVMGDPEDGWWVEVDSDGSERSYDAYYGYVGVLPLCNLSSDTLVSDEPDSEGYYTIQWNQAPTTPPASPYRTA